MGHSVSLNQGAQHLLNEEGIAFGALVDERDEFL
jgi:hypothetical protein